MFCWISSGEVRSRSTSSSYLPTTRPFGLISLPLPRQCRCFGVDAGEFEVAFELSAVDAEGSAAGAGPP